MMIGSVGEEEGIIDANNIMKEDGENFHDGHWNEGFLDKIGSEMNDNDWNEGFPDEVEPNMNDDGDDELDGGFGDDSVDSNMNDDGSCEVVPFLWLKQTPFPMNATGLYILIQVT
jgi:hypothetical protein